METDARVDPRLVGFGIKTFRDIREPAFLGPLSRINILGGANNAGKSALIAAIRVYLPPLDNQKLGNRNPLSLSALDTPQTADGRPPQRLSVGYGVDLGSDDPAAALVAAVTNRVVTRDEAAQLGEVRAIMNLPIFDAPEEAQRGPTLRWLWMEADDSGTISISAETIAAIDASARPTAALTSVTQSGYSGMVTWNGVLQKLVANTSAYKDVVYIPPERHIRSSDHRGTSLPSTNGEGLPGMLLSLLAPEAETFYSARDRLKRINEFLSDVLGRPSAQLLVPHNAQTVHVALEDRVLPLSHLGAGIEQVVLLAAIATEYSNSLLLLEEPDLFLHPTLQRQLLRHLHDSTTNTYLIATHSAAMLDTDYANVFRVDWTPDAGTRVNLVSQPGDRASLASSLGFRASDLVQANAVLWVEGPSDRIYIKRWLELLDDALVEGIHYSFVMYGGRLAEHLTGFDLPQGTISSDQMDRFLSVTRINRHSIFVMDSDLLAADQPLDHYKTRITKEFATTGSGLVWTTNGTMIENYLDPHVFGKAYKTVHPKKGTPYDGAMLTSPFAGGVKQPNKVGIADIAASSTMTVPDRGDLRKRMSDVRRYLRKVNGLPEAV
jgi:predicted ATPase